jgi:hypothetical protein
MYGGCFAPVRDNNKNNKKKKKKRKTRKEAAHKNLSKKIKKNPAGPHW